MFSSTARGTPLGARTLALCIAFLATVCLPSTALADAGSHIKGTMTAKSGGAALVGATVQSYSLSGSTWNLSAASTTDANGLYDLAGIPNGTYRLVFRTPGYLDEIYNAKLRDSFNETYNSKSIVDVGTSIAVFSGATTSNVNGSLTRAGTISGVVTDSVSHSPLPGVRVYGWRMWNAAWTSEPIVSATTDASGRYTLGNCTATSYRVQGVDPTGDHVAYFWPSSATVGYASSITVSAGATSTANLALPPSGHLAGTVTDAVTALPLSGSTVTVYQNQSGSWVSVASTSTTVLGTYNVKLPSGIYRIGFSRLLYVSEYNDNKSTVTSANDVYVYSGQVTTVNPALAPVPHLTGTVTEKGTGAAVAGLTVTAYVYSGGSWLAGGTTTTGTQGLYDFVTLSPGTYKVSFSDASHVRQYNGGAATLANAPPLTLGSAGLEGIDAVMTPGVRIMGKVVRAATSTGILGGTVNVYQLVSGSWTWVFDATTGSQGDYDSGPLPAGTYRVAFTVAGYARQFYNGAGDIASASSITLAEGAVASSIDARMVSQSTISGTLTDRATGAALPLVRVEVYRWDGSTWWLCNSVDSYGTGTYQISALPAGTYRVRFVDMSALYSSEWYGGQPDADHGTSVVVGQSAAVSGINGQLSRTSHIAGRVTHQGSVTPLSGAVARAYRADGSGGWTPWWSATADANGLYDIVNLPGGFAYRVSFTDPAGDHVGQTYDTKPDLASGADVFAAAGGGATGIDAALVDKGSISGVVTDAATGAVLPGSEVTLYADQGGWKGIATATSDDQGRFAFARLLAGAYRLGYARAGYSTLYSGRAADVDQATDVTLIPGQSAPGQDMALSRVLVAHPADITIDPTGIRLGFASITDTGTSTASLVGDSHGTPPGTRLLGSACWDIHTTATFTGRVLVTIPYGAYLGDLRSGDATRLCLYHFTGGSWVLVPSTTDTADQTISGYTDSFSDFGVFESSDPVEVSSPASTGWSIGLSLILAALVGAAALRKRLVG